jgi:hypothetical protein
MWTMIIIVFSVNQTILLDGYTSSKQCDEAAQDIMSQAHRERGNWDTILALCAHRGE